MWDIPIFIGAFFLIVAVAAIWYGLWERLGVSTGAATIIWILVGFIIILATR